MVMLIFTRFCRFVVPLFFVCIFLQQTNVQASTGNDAQLYVVKVSNAPVHESPSKDSPAVGYLAKGEWFLVEGSSSEASWVSYPLGYSNKRITGWVRREELLVEGDFVRVERCMPIKKVGIAVGDSFDWAEFKPDGSAIVGNDFGSGSGHAYFFGDLLLVDAIVDKGKPPAEVSFPFRLVMVFIYNKEKLRLSLYAGAVAEIEQEFYGRQDFIGCKK